MTLIIVRFGRSDTTYVSRFQKSEQHPNLRLVSEDSVNTVIVLEAGSEYVKLRSTLNNNP